MSDAKSQQEGRERIARVFRYLKALNEHRNPAKRDLSEQPWTLWFRHLPDHSLIQRRFPNGDQPDEEHDFVLKVGRPTFTQAPQPPLPIVDWLEGDWEDPEGELADSENKAKGTEPLRFDAEPRRVEAYERWKTQHQNWANVERPARAAMKIFEQLYELYGRIEREAEHIELVLGNGILSWKRGEEGEASIYHPILLQRIQLAFDPSVPEFTLIETGKEVELYSALFRSMPDIEAKVLARCREDLDRGGFHPLGGTDTLEFLRRFVVQLSPRGQFAEGPPEKEAEDPKIGRAPVLFLRTRTLGFATAIEGTLDDLAVREDLPLALLKIVGLDPPPKEDEQAAVQRKELLDQLRKHRQELFDARAEECREVIFLKTKLSPSDAARKVAAEAEVHGWIPAPVEAGAALPLSAAEIKELYASSEGLSVEDERELRQPLPEAKALLSPDEFEQAVQEYDRFSKGKRSHRQELWTAPLDEGATAALDKLLAKATKAVEVLNREQRWKISAVAAAKEGGARRAEWDGLLQMIDQLIQETGRAKESALRHAPVLADGIPLEEQLQIVDEILAHCKDGKTVGKLALLTHGPWKRFIAESRAAAGERKTPVHFHALRGAIVLAMMRRDLEGRWDRQMVPQYAPAWAALSEKPEEGAAEFATEIRRCLQWHAEEWEPIEQEL